MLKQWDLLTEMGQRVSTGALAFPRQVVAELTTIRFPDAPGAWIASAKHSVQHPEPAEESLVRVLAVAADLIEADHPGDPADPYVLAMALELGERHPTSQVVLVTNDVVDRLPVKIALRTGCQRVGVETCRAPAFLAWLLNPATKLVDAEDDDEGAA
ncbi:hypothetical protein [Pseudonocardia alni]|uniref:hypothetical protein n=1 Tax=Pseudonocardia alni TaxID=33907 RepID=UPI0027A978A5|nr:hypothetical protein PaSha_12655 [Pseudonocardia alni]